MQEHRTEGEARLCLGEDFLAPYLSEAAFPFICLFGPLIGPALPLVARRPSPRLGRHPIPLQHDRPRLGHTYRRPILSCLLTPSACSITWFVVILPVHRQAAELSVRM